MPDNTINATTPIEIALFEDREGCSPTANDQVLKLEIAETLHKLDKDGDGYFEMNEVAPTDSALGIWRKIRDFAHEAARDKCSPISSNFVDYMSKLKTTLETNPHFLD